MRNTVNKLKRRLNELKETKPEGAAIDAMLHSLQSSCFRTFLCLFKSTKGKSTKYLDQTSQEKSLILQTNIKR